MYSMVGWSPLPAYIKIKFNHGNGHLTVPLFYVCFIYLPFFSLKENGIQLVKKFFDKMSTPAIFAGVLIV